MWYEWAPSISKLKKYSIEVDKCLPKETQKPTALKRAFSLFAFEGKGKAHNNLKSAIRSITDNQSKGLKQIICNSFGEKAGRITTCNDI